MDGWDVVASGDLRDDARKKIVVARHTGGGTIRVYSYDNSGTRTLSLVRTLSIPFTAWDSANAAPGICYVDVIIADLTGGILGRRTALFRLDPP